MRLRKGRGILKSLCWKEQDKRQRQMGGVCDLRKGKMTVKGQRTQSDSYSVYFCCEDIVMGHFDYQNAMSCTIYTICYTPLLSNKADKLKRDINNSGLRTYSSRHPSKKLALFSTSQRLKVRRSLQSEILERGCSFEHKIWWMNTPHKCNSLLPSPWVS